MVTCAILMRMSYRIVQFVLPVAIGVYIIVFARSSYRHPDAVRRRWFHQLPDRHWALTLLRGMAVLWLFGGFMLIAEAATVLPVLREYRGVKLLLIGTVVAIAATALVVSTAPRQPGKLP